MGTTPATRCTSGPRSSARSGWGWRRWSTTGGNSRSTLPPWADHVGHHAGGRRAWRSRSISSDTSSIYEPSRASVAILGREPRSVAGFYPPRGGADELGVAVRLLARPSEVAVDPVRRGRVHAPMTPSPCSDSGDRWSRRTGCWSEFRAGIHRQGQPRAFLLGWGRPRVYPLFRPAVTKASGWRPQLPRTGSSSEPTATRVPAPATGQRQRRGLLLRLRLSATRRVLRLACRTGRRLLRRPARRVPAALRRGANRARTRDVALLSFFQTTYEAATELAGWDRASLEVAPALAQP